MTVRAFVTSLTAATLLLAAWPGVALAQVDPFAAYLDSAATVKESLGDTPSGSGAEAIVTRRFTLSSRGGLNTVFAIQVQPQAAGQYPAILVLHGGGSHADDMLGLAESLARTGYVTLAIDQPGICGQDNTPNSSGPWKTRPGAGGEEPRFDVASGPENSILVDAEVANIEAFNYLRAQPNVKPDAMGITGFSWGGYSTTILSGLLGSKVKAAYAVWGCGFYDLGSFWQELIAAMAPADRETWLTYFDAGRRGPQVKGAYFLEGASNDTYFWPEAVGASIEAVAGDKNHVWGPNLNHQQLPAGSSMQRLHFDYQLKGSGSAFAKATVSLIESQPDGSKQVTIDVAVPVGVSIDSAQLYYSEQGPAWPERQWLALEATPLAGQYLATIPTDIASKQINFYAFVTDTRMVSVSSLMFDSSSVVVPLPGGGGMGGAAGAAGRAGAAALGGAGAPGASGTAGNPPAASGGALGGTGTAGSAPSPMASQSPSEASCACGVPRSGAAGHVALALLALLGCAARRRWRAPA